MKPKIKLSLAKIMDLSDWAPDEDSFKTLIVDEESFQVLLQIEKDFEVFKQMDSDHARMVLLNVPYNELVGTWFWFCSSHYQDYHELRITNHQDVVITIANKEFVTQDPSAITVRYHIVDTLKHFRQCILQTINWILKDNGKEYRSWISHFMPKYLRTGLISRKKYYSIVGKKPEEIQPERVVYNIISRTRPLKFQRMTLGIYIQYWSLCYRLLNHEEYLNEMTDLEIFKKYNDCGSSHLKGLDLHSEEDFKKWQDYARSYHGFEILYVSISLYTFKGQDGTWTLKLSFRDVYWTQCLKLIIELDKRHIHLSSYKELLPRIKEEDYLMVCLYNRSTDFYYNQIEEGIELGHETIQIEMEDKEHRKALINAVQWLDEPYPEIADPRGDSDSVKESET